MRAEVFLARTFHASESTARGYCLSLTVTGEPTYCGVMMPPTGERDGI